MKYHEKPFTKTNKKIDRGQRSKILNEVKRVKNVSKNPQSFLEIRPKQKEAPSSNKLQDHTIK